MCLFTGCKTNITTQPLLVQNLLHPSASHGGSQHQDGQVTLLLFVFIRLSCQVEWKRRHKDTFCMLSEQPLTQPWGAVSLVTQQKCMPPPTPLRFFHSSSVPTLSQHSRHSFRTQTVSKQKRLC